MLVCRTHRQVRLKYGLTIDQREADALESVLLACESTAMVFTECAAGQEGASPEYVIPTAVNTPGRFRAYYKTRVVMCIGLDRRTSEG